MPGRTRAVLVDLDDTLFDHRFATRTALAGLAEVEPAFGAWPVEELARRHAEILEVLHLEVLAGRRTIDEARVERFSQLLAEAGATEVEPRAVASASFYRRAYERAWRPVPGALALMEALAQRRVPIAIVTNNKAAEQRRKLEGTGLDRYQAVLVTSEEVGSSKPDRRIFDVALAAVGAGPDETVMLGDAWPTDIAGAQAAGIRAVWLNRFGLPSPDRTVPELASLEPTEVVTDKLFSKPRAG